MCSHAQGFPAPGSDLCPVFRKAEYLKKSRLSRKSEFFQNLEVKAVSMSPLELYPEVYPKPGAVGSLLVPGA